MGRRAMGHKEVRKKSQKKEKANGSGDTMTFLITSTAYSAERILNYVTVNNDHRRMVESLNFFIVTN